MKLKGRGKFHILFGKSPKKLKKREGNGKESKPTFRISYQRGLKKDG